MLDALRFAGQHLEMAKQIEDAGLSQVRAVGIYAAEQAGFGGNGGLAAANGGVGSIDRLGKVGGTLGFDHNVIQTEGQHHLPGLLVQFRRAHGLPVGIGAQGLVAVTAVQVHQIVGAVNHLARDARGDALGHRSIILARVDAI